MAKIRHSGKICVYKFTSPTKKVYIGSTIDLRKRLSAYKNLDCEQQYKLYNSFKKYGFDKHKFEILCICDISDVRQKESYYGSLYNCLDKKAGLNLRIPYHNEGFPCISEETRIKMGKIKKGNQNNLGRQFSKEWCRNISIAQKKRKHYPHSKETRKKMSNSAMGGLNHNSKILINLQTGIYYECVMDAANSYGMNYNYFRSKLYNKRNKNNTPFIYV